MRLGRTREFRAVYEARVRAFAGPLVVWSAPNDLPHCRLGLAVSRRVGGAVVRNRLKRRLREAFRTMQHELPGGYDLVVSARPHNPLPVAEYREALRTAAEALHSRWRSRS
jgi:ribonuclease P protein component